MSLSTPILTLSSDKAPAAVRGNVRDAAATATTSPCFQCLNIVGFLLLLGSGSDPRRRSRPTGSDTQVSVQLFFFGLKIGRINLFYHLTVLDHVVPIGQRCGKAKILFYQNDREAPFS